MRKTYFGDGANRDLERMMQERPGSNTVRKGTVQVTHCENCSDYDKANENCRLPTCRYKKARCVNCPYKNGICNICYQEMMKEK